MSGVKFLTRDTQETYLRMSTDKDKNGIYAQRKQLSIPFDDEDDLARAIAELTAMGWSVRRKRRKGTPYLVIDKTRPRSSPLAVPGSADAET